MVNELKLSEEQYSGLVWGLNDIISYLKTNTLTYSDWIQIVAVIASLTIPLSIIYIQRLHSRKDKIIEEKMMIISLLSLLSANLSSLLGFKDQFLVKMKSSSDSISHLLETFTSTPDSPDFKKRLHDLINSLLQNKSESKSLLQKIAYPELIDIKLTLNDVRFVSVNIPNTFTIMNQLNSMYIQYKKVNDYRNTA
jgi:hypothetical protein